MEEQEPATTQSDFIRSEDFFSYYANNVRFEQSLFDLKLVFGQLDQAEGDAKIVQDVSVTIPWLQAKLCLYWLQLNLALYEEINGSISIPENLLPPVPSEPTGDQKNEPNAERIWELVTKMREQFVESLQTTRS